jgi:anthranilate synthase component 2
LILNKIPTLGICLGFQAITAYLNFKLNNQIEVKHGVSTKLKSISKTSILLKDIKENTKVGLYHSWYVKDYSNSQITSYSSSGIPMSFEDLDKRLFGVQFHPESVLTTEGKKIFRNFLDYLHSLNHLNQ